MNDTNYFWLYRISFITWIFFVMPDPTSTSSNALITFLLHILRSSEKNLFKSFLPFMLSISGESVPKIFTIDITLL